MSMNSKDDACNDRHHDGEVSLSWWIYLFFGSTLLLIVALGWVFSGRNISSLSQLETSASSDGTVTSQYSPPALPNPENWKPYIADVPLERVPRPLQNDTLLLRDGDSPDVLTGDEVLLGTGWSGRNPVSRDVSNPFDTVRETLGIPTDKAPDLDLALIAPWGQLTPLPAFDPPKREIPVWKANALTVGPWRQPAVAIIIDDMGLDRARTRRAVDLPGPLTLSYLTYAEHLADQMLRGRAAGHELLLHMPMEPLDSGINPGLNPLVVSLSDDEIVARLRENLGKGAGYIGINNHMGSRFTADERAMTVVVAELRRQGLVWIDSVTSPGTKGTVLASVMDVPYASRSVFLDHDPDRQAIFRQLAYLEKVASRNGTAIAIGHPREGTLQALAAWLPTLEDKGISLVPVSALLHEPALEAATHLTHGAIEERKTQ